MRRKLAVLLFMSMIAFLVGTASSASAASPHFKKNGSPVCTVSDGTTSASTTCRASLAGLGQEDLLVNVTVSGFAVYQCQNGGGNIAPGQNRVLVGPSTTPTSIDAGQIKNGNLTFTTNAAVLTAPSTVTGSQAGCPNANWTGVNPDLTLTSIVMTIEQPPGTVLFRCTASSSTGLSGTVALTC